MELLHKNMFYVSSFIFAAKDFHMCVSSTQSEFRFALLSKSLRHRHPVTARVSHVQFFFLN